MKTQDQVQLAAEHARSIINEIMTHKDLAVRLALLGPYHFAFQREFDSAGILLSMQKVRDQLKASESVPVERPKFSVIRGGK